MASRGKAARRTADFVQLGQQWLNELPRAHEPGRYVMKLDQFRDWTLPG